MSTVLIARFKNKREAGLAAKLIEKYNSEISIVKRADLEDFYLAQLIDEGMKEGGVVPLSKIQKKLSK